MPAPTRIALSDCRILLLWKEQVCWEEYWDKRKSVEQTLTPMLIPGKENVHSTRNAYIAPRRQSILQRLALEQGHTYRALVSQPGSVRHGFLIEARAERIAIFDHCRNIAITLIDRDRVIVLIPVALYLRLTGNRD